jgi:hypothetical protein
MPKSVFLIPPSGTPEQLTLADFVDEDELHSLVERVPELLDECLLDAHGGWIVVQREMGIPDAPSASDRWAVDLFLLDSEGVPTFVEVKRSKDPRTRREVIAQMLEYAANGSVYWRTADIRKLLQERSASSSDFLELFNKITDGDSDKYWSSVESKLSAGQVRLVFVADRIPNELRRLVEFLNERMPDVQVLALEVRQFKVGDRRIAVGEAVGNTMRSRDTKGRQDAPASLEDWLDRAEFADPTLSGKLASLFSSLGMSGVVLKPALSQLTLSVQTPSGRVQVIGANRRWVWLALASLRRSSVYVDEGARRTLLEKLEQIMGAPPTRWNLSGYPAFDITLLGEDDRREKFGEFGKSVIKEVSHGYVLRTEDHPMDVAAQAPVAASSEKLISS